MYIHINFVCMWVCMWGVWVWDCGSGLVLAVQPFCFVWGCGWGLGCGCGVGERAYISTHTNTFMYVYISLAHRGADLGGHVVDGGGEDDLGRHEEVLHHQGQEEAAWQEKG